MKVLAIIAEYNPFHNGHLYQLQESLRKSKADYTICIMSGHFLQRGEPALVNKWARTMMALQAGIDLVIELPFAYAVRSARDFAFGAVTILECTGVVNQLSFGSESGTIEELKRVAEIMTEEPSELGVLIKDQLSLGIPYPKAQAKAIQTLYPALADDLWQPNNILAIEYLKALKKIKSEIEPLTITRKSSHYHDLSITDNIASASAIRETLKKADNQSLKETLRTIQEVVPQSTLDILEDEFNKGRGPIFDENFAQSILTSLRKTPENELREIIDVIEGLEGRIKEKSFQTGSFQSLVQAIKTRRYTRTRIQRILIHHLLGFSKKDALIFQQGPQYIRILGLSSRATVLVKEIKKRATLPLLQKVSSYKKDSFKISLAFERMLSLDLLSSDLYCLSYPNPQYRLGNGDYYFSPIPFNSSLI